MFLLHALVEALCIENTSMCPVTFLKEYDQMLVPDKDTGNTTVEKQFQVMLTFNLIFNVNFTRVILLIEFVKLFTWTL